MWQGIFPVLPRCGGSGGVDGHIPLGSFPGSGQVIRHGGQSGGAVLWGFPECATP